MPSPDDDPRPPGASGRSRLLAVTVDARDPRALAAFWAAALGTDVVEEWTDAHGTGYVGVSLTGDATLLFQRVDAPADHPPRLHLDVCPVSGGRDDEVARLVGLGARVVDEAPDHPWVVLADPEGHPFCVLPAR